MIDPFGVKGSPMQLIGRILRNPKSECLISFMYEPIRRFHRQPEFGGHLDDLFGTRTWRDCIDVEDEADSKDFCTVCSPNSSGGTGRNTSFPSNSGKADATSTRCISQRGTSGDATS